MFRQPTITDRRRKLMSHIYGAGRLLQRALLGVVHHDPALRVGASRLGSGSVPGILRRRDGEYRAASSAALLECGSRTGDPQYYDIAVSFADEERDYVESVVVAAKALGLRVFYDRDMAYSWWGLDFVLQQRRVYRRHALHMVPFISEAYLAKIYTMDEFSYAMIVSLERGGDYILPVLIADVQVPEELLHPYVSYLRMEDHTPEQLAAALKARVDYTRAHGYRSQRLIAPSRQGPADRIAKAG